MKREGLALRWHLMQQGIDEKEIEKELKKWELNRENVLAAREAKEAEKRSNKKDKSQASEAAPEAEEAKTDEPEAAPEAEEASKEESSDETGEEE